MTGEIRIRNWRKFQHYKDRRPDWIKLHSELLDKIEYRNLTDAQKGQLTALWMLAARLHDATDDDPTVPGDTSYISALTGCKFTTESLQAIEKAGFISLASSPLADCEQSASPEKEKSKRREREREEEEVRVFDAWLSTQGGRDLKLTPSRRKKIRARLKEGYSVDDLRDAVRGWVFDDWKDRPMHCDLTQLLGTGDKAEKWRDLYRANRKADDAPASDRFASVARATIETAELSDEDRERLLSLVSQPEVVCDEFEALTGRPLV